MAQVVDAADHGAEALAVAGDAADRDAAEVDAVVAAILSAVSTASEPELVKNTLSSPAGAISTSFSASSKAFGCAMLKGGAKSISAACSAIARTIFGRACPALTHQRPATASSTWRPSGVQ
jgi:hypothetical protein